MQKKKLVQTKIEHYSKLAANAYNSRDYQKMVKNCLEILKISSDNFEATLNVGVAYVMQNDTKNGEKYFLKALSLDPSKWAVYINLATLYTKRGDSLKAIQIYQQAIGEYHCNEITIYNNLGLLLQEFERFDEAKQVYVDLLTSFPTSFMGYINLGNVDFYQQNYDKAVENYQQAIKHQPNCAEAYNGIGMVHQYKREYKKAIEFYTIALKYNPNLTETHLNLAYAKAHSNPDDSDKIYLDFLQKYPNHPKMCNNLAYFYLKKGNLFEGFRYYEYRCDPSIKNSSTKTPHYHFPKWKGETLLNKSIIVVLEQGFGDQIQFIRYVALLKEIGAAKIHVVCELGLKRLFATIPEIDFVATPYEPIPAADYWTFIMSLPYQFKTTLRTIPVHVPYLFPDRERVKKFKDLLPHNKKKIGIFWRGNKKHYNDANRSINLEEIAPIWEARDDIVFVSVQKGEGEDEAKNTPKSQPILYLGDHIEDFLDTAALFENLDILISVDTAVVHLAGALGLECYVLLPAVDSDWRWFEKREDSPWYPSVKLFRQKNSGSWQDVIEEVKQSLLLSKRIL